MYLQQKLDENHLSSKKVYWVIDGDKTLCSVDTASIYWNKNSANWRRLKKCFDDGYNYHAFLQASCCYSSISSLEKAECIGRVMAAKLMICSEWKAVLNRDFSDIGVIVLTAGIRNVWEHILAENGLSHIPVISGNEFCHGFVIDGDMKAAVVTYLKSRAGVKVLAFGDSPVDFKMLECADVGVVINRDVNSCDDQMNCLINKAAKPSIFQVSIPNNVPLRKVDLPITNLGWLWDYSKGTYSSVCSDIGQTNASKLLQAKARNVLIHCGRRMKKSGSTWPYV